MSEAILRGKMGARIGSTRVYFDYNSTTPLAPEVVDDMTHTMVHVWGNPSSSHALGTEAKTCIEKGRQAIGRMIGGRPEDIVFTSGGTEANNVAILSGIHNRNLNSGTGKPHVITTSVEHDSVKKCLEDLENRGIIELSTADVSGSGRLEPEAVFSLVQEYTCLMTIMHANNETGIVMPIAEIGQQLKILNGVRSEKGMPQIFFHTDAAQSVGKIRVSVEELGVDYLTIVGHKFYGPRSGALYVKNIGQGTPIIPLLQGGGQERGYRPGTENVVMISGLGVAASLVAEHIDEYSCQMQRIRDTFKDRLIKEIPGIRVNFEGEKHKLPNTLSVRVPLGLSGSEVMKKCGDELIASLGAACHSNVESPSSILMASGLSEDEARRTIRLSVGRETIVEEIEIAAQVFASACKVH